MAISSLDGCGLDHMIFAHQLCYPGVFECCTSATRPMPRPSRVTCASRITTWRRRATGWEKGRLAWGSRGRPGRRISTRSATTSGLTWLAADGQDGRGARIGYDFNFNSVKSVGIAREIIGHYDPAEGQRIEDAHREAVAYAMGHVEGDMAVRLRAGGRNEDEITGNMIAMRVTHRTTRPNEDDYTPDMSLHDHVFVINASFDENGEAKAAELGRIIHDAPYYEAIYHNRLAANLRAMGYGIRRTEKGFEVAGISDGLIERYSRRRATIKKVPPSWASPAPEGFDKLGATTPASQGGFPAG